MKQTNVLLWGRPASQGQVVGRALVLQKLPNPDEDLEFELGDILVVHHLPPDLLIKVIGIAGIVAEVGGVASHAATLARELAIPCIVGVEGATQTIPNQSLILLNALEGIVQVWDGEKS